MKKFFYIFLALFVIVSICFAKDTEKTADSCRQKGLTYYKSGKYELAIKEYNKAIKLKPDFDFAYSNRGYAEFMLQHFNEALNDFNIALSLNPSNSDALVKRGKTEISMNNKSGACDDFFKAAGLNNDEAKMYIIKYCSLK